MKLKKSRRSDSKAESKILRENLRVSRASQEELEDVVLYKAQEARQKDRELEAFIQGASIGILVLNNEGGITRINPHAGKIFGYSTNELLHKNAEMLISWRSSVEADDHGRKVEKKMLLRTIHEGKAIFGKRKDGTEFPVEVSLSPYSISRGKFTIVFVSDITSRKQAEMLLEERTRSLERSYKMLAQKNLSLKRMNRELQTFTYVSSHDLQEPLRKIKNFLSLVLEDKKNPLHPDARKYLEKGYATAGHMRELLEDLLAYFRVKDTGIKFKKIDLKEVLNEVRKEYAEVIEKKKAKVRYEDLGGVRMARYQFRQLFHNLISNSLKFAKPGRAPIIEIKTDIVTGDHEFNKQLSRKTKYYHITYTDNGIGFKPQYNARIFGLFQRLNRQGEYRGSGIGLAICKRIIENHNGIIKADGKPNKGTRFDIYIPIGKRKIKKKAIGSQ